MNAEEMFHKTTLPRRYASVYCLFCLQYLLLFLWEMLSESNKMARDNNSEMQIRKMLAIKVRVMTGS